MCFIFGSYNQSGTYTVAANVLLTILQSSRLCQHIHTGLCTGICRRAQVTCTGSHRPDIDNRTTLILLHIRQYTLCSIKSTAQITLENMIPHLQGQLIHTSILQSYICRIVYQNVDFSVLLRCIRKKCFNTLCGCNIHKVIGCFSACIHNTVNNSLSLLLSASANNYLSTLSCKQFGDTHTNSAGRTGNNGNLVL